MGDHRINLEISLVGVDGETRRIDWWLNWHENMPARVFDALVRLASESQLPVNSFYDEDDRAD